MKTKKTINALIALACGVLTAPLAMAVWPAFVAWFVWSETEEELNHTKRGGK